MDGRISLFDNPGFTVSGENNEISSNFQLRNVDFDINVETDGELLISGVISHNNSHGMFDFSKSGEGTLTLSGNNTYGNNFEINAGTVVAASATALGSGNVSVGGETNATLVFANTVTAGTISLAEGSKFALDLSEFPVSGSDEDLILNILSGAASLSFDGFEGDVLTSDVIEGYFSEEASVLGQFEDYARTWSYENNVLSLTFAAIPEPSAFGLLAGIGALALVAARRRRRQ